MPFKMQVDVIYIIYRNDCSQFSIAVVLFFLSSLSCQQNTNPVAEEGINSCTEVGMGLSEKRVSGERHLCA